MQSSAPVFKQLVLVGGGHAHALVIRMWAMKPVPGVRLVLVSPNWQTPYSGMLPGLLAGHYTTNDVNIDLRRLCNWAGVRFIEDKVVGIDRHTQSLMLQTRGQLEYDLLSLDIGSTPDSSLPGQSEFAETVKPIDRFYPRFLSLVERCRAAEKPLSIAVVGGGAGGVEVILALSHRLRSEGVEARLHLAVRDDSLLADYPPAVTVAAERALIAARIALHRHFDVAEVKETALIPRDGEQLEVDEVYFCTHAKAASWVSETGLDVDKNGFVRVNRHLQSLSDDKIFAAGDIAAMVDTPLPKAGVYAVRQGPVLFENLRRRLFEKPLKTFRPQTNFLSLLSLGGKRALASRSPFSVTVGWSQALLWQWKDHIDRRFMAKFSRLPAMERNPSPTVAKALIPEEDRAEEINPEMRCAGCGGKVGTDLLQQVLLDVTSASEFAPEDAAEFPVAEATLIQTVDQIKSPIDDPYLFGRIAALHALSDAFAMNASPTSAQLLLNLPYAGRRIQRREMQSLMCGILEALDEHGCALLGGHTAEGHDLSVGMVVNAEKRGEEPLFKKGGLQPGDHLVLTKRIGIGVILAADMQAKVRGDWMDATLDTMTQSNRGAAELFGQLGVQACTDVTGFGLIGHLIEMLRASSVSAQLSLEKIPLLDGALELSAKGVTSSLYRQNLNAIKALSDPETVAKDPRFALLFDPQTSGGLLAGVKASKLEELKNFDPEFWVIGQVHAVANGCDWGLRIE